MAEPDLVVLFLRNDVYRGRISGTYRNAHLKYEHTARSLSCCRGRGFL